MTASTSSRPETDLDLFDPALVANPFEVWDQLRDTGAAVYLTRNECWVLTRYDEVRDATADWHSFTSASGTGLNDDFNATQSGSALAASDPPAHDRLRAALADKLTPRAIAALGKDVDARAERLVAQLRDRNRFDAVTDLALVLALDVVIDLVGVPVGDRAVVADGSDAALNLIVADSEMLEQLRPTLAAYHRYIVHAADSARPAPDSWGAALAGAVDGEALSAQDAIGMFSALLTKGAAAAQAGIVAAVKVLVEQPDAAAALTDDPSLCDRFVEEVFRIETPLPGLFRQAAKDVQVGDVLIGEGERVMLHWGAANRDPRRFSSPERVDLTRAPADHLAFGYGLHACAGQGLARLEAAAVVRALLPVMSILGAAGVVTWHDNPVLRRLAHLPLTFEASPT